MKYSSFSRLSGSTFISCTSQNHRCGIHLSKFYTLLENDQRSQEQIGYIPSAAQLDCGV